MTITPIEDVWFDDAATLAMGEAFDNACKSLENFGSAVPAIIADLIIAGAKNGERDPVRLYEQAIIIFAIEDTSMPRVSVGRDPPSQPTLRSRMQRDLKRARLRPSQPGSLPSQQRQRLKSTDGFAFTGAWVLRSCRLSAHDPERSL